MPRASAVTALAAPPAGLGTAAGQRTVAGAAVPSSRDGAAPTGLLVFGAVNRVEIPHAGLLLTAYLPTAGQVLP